ncbi:MAG: adenylate kinase [Bacteroidales bacterium]|jgi:adenylate kinase|nr:adenylate kinase [Bacteroidales bacterium]
MIIILLGPPGAGKGTIADKVKRIVSIPVIATGDILRKAIETGSDLGKKVKSFVVSGKLVPDDYIIKIVEDRIREYDCEKGFIFDGFPRTINQAKELELVFKRLDRTIDQVFYFDISYETIINRLSARRVCTKCGAIYNLKYDPPEKADLCSKCGGKLIQRVDDQEDTIKRRVDVYNEETLPLVSYYEKKNILTKIDADQDLQDIFKILWNKLIEIGVI